MTSWLTDNELRVGLGCMRLSTEPARDEGRGIATIHAAIEAGVTVLDSAHAYALDDADRGHNERLIAQALATLPLDVSERVRVVTKGGMRRPAGRWLVDAKARALQADCAASRAALEGLPIDLYLLHAPDPAVPFATSIRALTALLGKGHVRRIGLSNVTRAQLDEALALGAPISAVELQLGWLDDTALKGGVVARCIEQNITVIAHRPLGGAGKVRSMASDKALRAVAEKHRATPAVVALAVALDLDKRVVVIPGATRPESARGMVDAARVAAELDDEDRALLSVKLSRARIHGPPRPRAEELVDGEVVLVMGIQGAGKTTSVTSWIERGYTRLNRDELGGTIKQLHALLDEKLSAGARRVVLDNTYVTRAMRREAIEVAWRHKVPVRGVWLETPLASAQVNVVLRMLEHHGRLLMPDEMAKLDSPTALPPHAQHRMLKKLERPALDEGFAHLDVVELARRAPPAALRGARFISLDTLVDGKGRVRDSFAVAFGADPVVPRFVYAWRARREPAFDVVTETVRAAGRALAGDRVSVGFAECVHGAGPPICWCRPPLPGLVLAYAVANAIDASRSVVVARGPAHKALAAAIGARFEEVGARSPSLAPE